MAAGRDARPWAGFGRVPHGSAARPAPAAHQRARGAVHRALLAILIDRAPRPWVIAAVARIAYREQPAHAGRISSARCGASNRGGLEGRRVACGSTRTQARGRSPTPSPAPSIAANRPAHPLGGATRRQQRGPSIRPACARTGIEPPVLVKLLSQPAPGPVRSQEEPEIVDRLPAVFEPASTDRTASIGRGQPHRLCVGHQKPIRCSRSDAAVRSRRSPAVPRDHADQLPRDRVNVREFQDSLRWPRPPPALPRRAPAQHEAARRHLGRDRAIAGEAGCAAMARNFFNRIGVGSPRSKTSAANWYW